MPRATVRPANAAGTVESVLPHLGASILLVTDDDVIGRLCTSLLQQAGYVVTHARHSGHALLACMSGPRMDLLITELAMPEGSGVALTARLRKHSAALKALYLGSAGTTYEAGDVLVRPFSRDELLARVRAALTSPPPAA
jgi:DNA-binding response OmpR family regulator